MLPQDSVSLDLGNLAACLCHNDPLNLNSDDLDARKPGKRCVVNATTLYYQGLQGGQLGIARRCQRWCCLGRKPVIGKGLVGTSSEQV